jgi:hypothetical protein
VAPIVLADEPVPEVLPVVLPAVPVAPDVLPVDPAVLPDVLPDVPLDVSADGVVVDGVVVDDGELVEVLPLVEASSFLPQALRPRAATAAMATTQERVTLLVFISIDSF